MVLPTCSLIQTTITTHCFEKTQNRHVVCTYTHALSVSCSLCNVHTNYRVFLSLNSFAQTRSVAHLGPATEQAIITHLNEHVRTAERQALPPQHTHTRYSFRSTGVIHQLPSRQTGSIRQSYTELVFSVWLAMYHTHINKIHTPTHTCRGSHTAHRTRTAVSV